jgi:hypothetical protein
LTRRAAALIAALGSLAAPAAAWEIRSAAPEADLEAFHDRFAIAAYLFPRHPAKPLGVVGFDVWADASYVPDFEDEPFASTVVDGDLTNGAISVARAGVRKGLPGRLDLGVAYGRALETDLELLSAEVQWAIHEGGAVAPAIGVRVTGTESRGDETYRLRQYGAEALISKGFAMLTPFAGAGLVHSEGRFRQSVGGDFETDDTRGVVFGGLTLNLLIPKITVEVERGEDWQAAARVSVGF